MKDEYTFVTLDNDMVTMGDAEFVEIDSQADVDFVYVDSAEMQDAGFIYVDDASSYAGEMDIDFYTSDISDIDVSFVV